MMVINLPMSALLLALSIAGFILLSRADRKSGEDRYRVYTCLCGVAGMPLSAATTLAPAACV